jgi:glycerate 2-kinase
LTRRHRAARSVLAAPDKFRGSASAREAAAAIAAGAARLGWACRELPLADGGEGTLDALGGPNRSTTVTGPLGASVDAPWRLDEGLAVIETARASGLALAGGAERNDPLAASTRGTGELIAAAIDAGATRIVVGVGGSATTDGGLGAIEALGRRPFREAGVTVEVACDVRTLFADAAALFAPQKGASAGAVLELGERLRRLAAEYRRDFEVDVTALPGSGAAGGLAGGLAALGATIAPGFELVAAAAGLEDALADVDVVVTGEGLLDRTSFAGKVVGGVLEHASRAGIRAVAVVGEARIAAPLPFVALVERYGRERAWEDTLGCIADAAEELLRRFEP